jgi:hypothetical protein
MRFVQVLLALLLLTLVPSRASAEQRQFGNIIYTPLSGWYAGGDEGGKLNLLSDLPNDLCEFCYIYLTNSRLGRGNLKTFLKREHLRFVDEDDQGSVTVMGEPSVITIAGHDAVMQGQKVGTDVQILVAVALDDRFELLGFQGGAYDEADLQTTMSVFQDQVAPFFEQLTFVSAGAAPLLPKPQPGEMEGVWWGWSTYSTFGLDMVVRQEMDFRTLVFWPDGYFYDGTPPEGLLPIKPDTLQARADPQYGVYEQSGGALTLTFASGETETLNAEGAGWVDGSKTLTEVEPLADGEKLDGSISSFFFTGFTPGSGLEGGISSASSTEFFEDGTYKGESFGGAFANFTDGGGYTTGSENATGGTYVVQNGLVISTPSDGGPPTAALGLRLDDENVLIGDQFLESGE